MKWMFSIALILALAVPSAFGQKTTSTEQELIALEHNWSQAAVNRDAKMLPRFYADEYIFTNEEGAISTKDHEIANITGGVFKLVSFNFENVNVRVYGNVAVVTGKNTIKGYWEDLNRDISGPYRFTDVFVKRSGEWRCVASQASRVLEATTP